MPTSVPYRANRRWPSASISATMSLARVAVSYPSWGLPDSPMPRWSGATTEKSRARRRHDQAELVPELGPAVHQQQRRPVAAGDRVQAQLAGVDVPAGERVGEPVWEIRRPGDRAGAFGGGR